MQIVDQWDSSTQRMKGKVWIVMEIAEKCDGEAIHRFGPARQNKILSDNPRKIRLKKEAVP
jgi:hypothetical protein